jgi:ATP-dependent DNA helicase PIF1
MPKITLTQDQTKAMMYMMRGKNVFITGSAGVGKSFVLESYYKRACKKFGPDKVFKTSTTGISALNIGGRTIHSWAGVGIGDKTAAKYVEKMFFKTKRRWKDTCVLFLDEVSMINAELFDKINIIAKKIRGSSKPFGGIQIILSGDFFQLLPVKSDLQCFEANTWSECVDKTVEMRQVVRQSDEKFVKMLNEIRYGYCSNDTFDILQDRIGVNIETKDGIKPTKLYPKNYLVDKTNKSSLKKLLDKGRENHRYRAEYFVKSNRSSKKSDKLIEDFRKYSNIPDDITLAVGTQVVFKKNIDEQVANGSRGIVSSFIKTEEGSGSLPFIPVVTLTDGTDKLVEPLEFEYSVEGEFKVIKLQIPLKLAWASSIHSSQGSTLELVEANVGDEIFGYGMTYVVLSRVKTLEGLSLISFNRDKIMANPKVLEKYGPKADKPKEKKNIMEQFITSGQRVYIDNKCSLCQETYEETPDMKVITLYCGHIFHQKCSEKYNKEKCAICREQI